MPVSQGGPYVRPCEMTDHHGWPPISFTALTAGALSAVGPTSSPADARTFPGIIGRIAYVVRDGSD